MIHTLRRIRYSDSAASWRAAAVSRVASFWLEQRHAFALLVDAGFGVLVGGEQRLDQVVTELLAVRGRQRLQLGTRGGAPSWSVARRMPRPNSALSSNSELFHAGPRPSASVV